MSAEIVEPIPHTDLEAVRAHFMEYGHVGVQGLLDPSLLEPAIREADGLSLRPRERVLGEQVSTLRRAPDARRQPALHGVLLDIEETVAALDRDITPSSRGEKPLIQLIRMYRGVKGPLHQDSASLADVVAITNLDGRSSLWFEAAEQGGQKPSGDGVQYVMEPGQIVIHDLRRNLWHRGYTDDQAERVGLAVAKIGGRNSN